MSNNNNTPMASCTGRIYVVKDGEDGVGIKGADVVYAVYADNVNAPSDDYSGWKTLYSQLTLVKGSYVWTATRITNTNDKSWLTGKRCLGLCDNFASIRELYALGDSNQSAPDAVWKDSYTPTKGKYLWTKNELTFQNNEKKEYTTPICIGYFANDGINGTKFSPRGTAEAHYGDANDIKQYLWGGVYIVDKDTKSTPAKNYPCVYTFLMTGNTSVKAEDGDAYNVGGRLWVKDGDAWRDFGSVQGAQGESGESAPWVWLSANPLVFESDDKGIAKSETKMVDLVVYLGSAIITPECDIAIVEGDNSNYDYSAARITGAGGETVTISVPSDAIAKKPMGGYNISYPNSSLTLNVAYGDYVFKVVVNIVVDTSLVDGYFRTSIKGLEAKYTEIDSNVTEQGNQIALCQTSIDANAKEIKNRVSQTDYNTDNTTREERFSAIEQKADEINQTVAAVDQQGKETKAQLDLCVEKQEDGSYVSKMKAYADNITFSAGHVLNIQGNYLVVNTTNFKLDENGNVSLTGEINATSGKLGNMTISDKLESEDGSVQITPNNIKIHGRDSDWGSGSYVHLGVADEGASFCDFYGVSDGRPIVSIISGHINDSGGAPALSIGSYYNTVAIELTNGCIGGFNRGTKLLKNDTTITDNSDASCLVYDGSGGTVYLDADNRSGTEFIIFNEGTGKLTIKVKSSYIDTKHNVLWLNGNGGKIEQYVLGVGGVIHAVLTGTYWHLW